MKNHYFQFKKFIIYQQNVGLKMSTEACIFGASVPCENAKKILDIGTGTGILSLFCSQRNTQNATIDAIDIDENAYNQAKENVENSVFKAQINVFFEKLQNFLIENNGNINDNTQKYDLIISNPPFFEAHFSTQNIQKKHAKHADTLNMEDLALHSVRLLSEMGVFWVIFPPLEMEKFEKIAEKYHLFLYKKIKIFQNEHQKIQHKIFREICGFSFQKTQESEIIKENFCIYAQNNENSYIYSNDFKTLLKEFYLYLD